MRALALLAAAALTQLAAAAQGPFRVTGSKVYDSNGNWVVFKGIGFTCTEYMTRPMFPAPPGGGDWPGKFGWENCFVGSPGPNQTIQLNNETGYVLNYLRPDTMGGSFQTAPAVKKVAYGAPWDEAVDPGSPHVVPIVRIPVTSGSYLYDEECNDVGAAGYRTMIDLLVQKLTSNGVAVIIDQHGCCAEGGKLKCVGDGRMAQRTYGNYSGAGAFWANVSATYAANPLVLYELYNEPHNVWYQAWEGGTSGDPDQFNLIGMSEMLDIVRNNTPTGLVIVESTDWGHDANFPLAFYAQYTQAHNKTPPANVVYSLHPYKGMFQGNEKAVRGTMRLALALKTIGPVLMTELGQYCCNAPEPGVEYCESKPPCDDHAHGDWFVHNLLNMATQFDLSWVGWAWRGTGFGDGHNCTAGMAQCGTPDMRDVGADNVTGVLTSGWHGGANWTEVWGSYVSPPGGVITIQDALPDVHLNGTAYEPKGYLPRPCIVGQFGLGGYCGYPLGTNMSVIEGDFNSFWNGTQGASTLPGLPPSLPASCTLQACPGWECNATSPVVPAPHPCGK